MKKFKIGITGGIGSGKSFVSDIIEKFGFRVIRSDLIAKELMNTDDNIKKKIIEAFGKNVYNDDNLNTQLLAKQIFSSKEKIEKINSIVHPPTIQKINSLIEQTLKDNNIVFVESALIYEAKIQKLFDFIILVYSDEQTRIARVSARDNATADEILKRIKFQIPDEKKKEKAHFVLKNDSTFEQLEQRTSLVIKIISSIAA